MIRGTIKTADKKAISEGKKKATPRSRAGKNPSEMNPKELRKDQRMREIRDIQLKQKLSRFNDSAQKAFSRNNFQ